ncbi:MAG: 4Fe-4S binding protein [Prolixibacteraceae bacterium]|nr:4Fe-4S binding protein [Prolixibacteraceae bacterium]
MRFNQKINLPRFILQWSVIVFLLFLGARAFLQRDYIPDFEAYCPFGGVQALSSYFLSNSLACSMTTTQIAMGIMLIIGIILFSKLFCAFICPIGTISEWLGNVGDKFKVSIKISRSVDLLLRSLKYILLFVTFYYTLDSNELFCKKFDPYYAVASGFSLDVVWYFAVVTIVLVIVGSILFRLFWCKYICPLGAISNIFKFIWFFIGVVLIYVIILATGIRLSYVWPLAVVSIGGYLLEIFGGKLNFFPVAKITRNESSCTNCRLCSRKCPQVIDVAKLKVVTDVDCNLCGECLEVCPEKDTLQINRQSGLKWLPVIVTIVLFVIGLTLSLNWELPTIEQRWGSATELEKASVFTRSGLTEIKCFGSSTAFANKMREVTGVLGVATYVTTHTVKVWYDPAILTDLKIQEEIFTPQKALIRELPDSIQNIKMITCQLDNFFDPNDFSHLTLLLKEKSDVLGLESVFSCPVTVRLFLPGNSDLNEATLKELVETKTLNINTKELSTHFDLTFKLIGTPLIQSIRLTEYKNKMFEPYQRTFNWKNNYRETMLDTFKVQIDPKQYDIEALPYLVSHLSNDNGVVGFHSVMGSTSSIYFNIIYLDSLTNGTLILKNMKNDTLTINYEGGETGKIANKFKF